MKRSTETGFTLLEALIVIAISIVLSAVAIPVFTNSIDNYRLNSTVSAVSGAITTTRMQAIMHGYPYQIVFTPSSWSYQIYNEVPTATTFSLVVPQIGSATTPLPNSGPITMTGLTGCTSASWPPTASSSGCTAAGGTTITYTFNSNGTVTSSPTGVGLQLQWLIRSEGSWVTAKSNTIWVSGVGDVATSNP